jgi:hypothetical protein
MSLPLVSAPVSAYSGFMIAKRGANDSPATKTDRFQKTPSLKLGLAALRATALNCFMART